MANANKERRTIRGADLKLGDDLLFLGDAHRVRAFEPYRHPTIETPARIAHDGTGWGMTVFDTDWVEVVA